MRIQNEDDGWANVEIMPNESAGATVTVVAKTVSSTRPGGSQQGSLGVLRHDQSTPGAVATLRRVYLKADSNHNAFAPGRRDTRPHSDSVSGRDAVEEEPQDRLSWLRLLVTPSKAKPKSATQEPQERLSWLRLPWSRR